jgi:acyl-coenzyme A synthetase/AMP-(fatty) acid ligase
MRALPLVSHTSPDNVIAYRADGPVTVREFLADVRTLAARMPAAGHLLNMCSDRYCFSVGLAAAIVSRKVSLLPSTHTPGVIRHIRDYAPDVFCLTDGDACAVDLPLLHYGANNAGNPASTAEPCAIPEIDGEQLIAIVFTSGSTGTPQPHRKFWGALVHSVRAEAQHLGLPPSRPCAVIGTVPPQHMYGFESTVLLCWQNGHALSHAQPFYPADIVHALARVAAPRVLVSSPLHLRALLDADLVLPDMALVVSATAPLSGALARDLEARCRAPLMEIFGSTETGQIASRRSTQTARWHLFPGVKFVQQGERVYACGGHIESPVAMNDLLEPVGDEHFLLHGRVADLINIAGKRHSLASLNHLLNSIPGVVDGAFYMPDAAAGERVTRLAACVVAPAMDAPQLLAALREHLDPVFLPRPLLFVPALPRNSTGKLPRAALQALFDPQRNRASA